MTLPKDIVFDPGPLPLIWRFGRSEVENAAAMVVRWHHVNSPDAWVAVSRRQIADFIGSDDVCREWFKNPFFGVAPRQLRDRGLFSGWEDDDAPGMFTELGMRCLVERGLWDRLQRENREKRA